jgi:hypothetical protein
MPRRAAVTALAAYIGIVTRTLLFVGVNEPGVRPFPWFPRNTASYFRSEVLLRRQDKAARRRDRIDCFLKRYRV